MAPFGEHWYSKLWYFTSGAILPLKVSSAIVSVWKSVASGELANQENGGTLRLVIILGPLKTGQR